MPEHEAPRAAGHPSSEMLSTGASQEPLLSLNLSALEREIEIIQQGFFVRQAGLINSKVEGARRRLNDLVKLGTAAPNEQVETYQQLGAMTNSNADVAIRVYHTLYELVEHQAHLSDSALVEYRIVQARSELDSLFRVRSLILSEPIWRCRRLEATINGNADVALDVYHTLSTLLKELVQSAARPAYTAYESERLTEIRNHIQAASANPKETR